MVDNSLCFDPRHLFRNLGPNSDLFGNELLIGARVRILPEAIYDPAENRIRNCNPANQSTQYYLGKLKQVAINFQGQRCYRVDVDTWHHEGKHRPIIKGFNDIVFPPVNAYEGELPSFLVELLMSFKERHQRIGRYAAEQRTASAEAKAA